MQTCSVAPQQSVLLIFILGLEQEVGSGNTSQKSDEEDFVKVEDLPLQLTVMCEVCNADGVLRLMGVFLLMTHCYVRRSCRRG